jgi:hypothetical protein
VSSTISPHCTLDAATPCLRVIPRINTTPRLQLQLQLQELGSTNLQRRDRNLTPELGIRLFHPPPIKVLILDTSRPASVTIKLPSLIIDPRSRHSVIVQWSASGIHLVRSTQGSITHIISSRLLAIYQLNLTHVAERPTGVHRFQNSKLKEHPKYYSVLFLVILIRSSREPLSHQFRSVKLSPVSRFCARVCVFFPKREEPLDISDSGPPKLPDSQTPRNPQNPNHKQPSRWILLRARSL